MKGTRQISLRLVDLAGGNFKLGGGGVGVLYMLYGYMYVPPQRVWFLSHFRLKTARAFDHYGLKVP